MTDRLCRDYPGLRRTIKSVTGDKRRIAATLVETQRVAYLALGPNLPTPVAGTDASAAHWVPVDAVVAGRAELAFDPGLILREALERARSQTFPGADRRTRVPGDRPAALYRRGTAKLLLPPLLRSGEIAEAHSSAAALR